MHSRIKRMKCSRSWWIFQVLTKVCLLKVTWTLVLYQLLNVLCVLKTLTIKVKCFNVHLDISFVKDAILRSRIVPSAEDRWLDDVMILNNFFNHWLFQNKVTILSWMYSKTEIFCPVSPSVQNNSENSHET